MGQLVVNNIDFLYSPVWGRMIKANTLENYYGALFL